MNSSLLSRACLLLFLREKGTRKGRSIGQFVFVRVGNVDRLAQCLYFFLMLFAFVIEISAATDQPCHGYAMPPGRDHMPGDGVEVVVWRAGGQAGNRQRY